ncbi:MAG: galactose mutarotase [Bacteroidales bacterium]|nr:galactose mutarotase [Bacteroidales bacterium]MBR4585185.1 galactose mutarotase [Bacteroidales bacterium]
MAINRKIWGKTQDGKAIYKYTVTNASGASVVLTNIGAGIVAINVPDKAGKLGDVVLGYGKAESYFADGPCSGKVPGRYANRIAKGKFTLDGKEYTLPINNGPNHLHGGPEGFQNQVWESRKHKGGVEFKYVSADGEMGYPGKLVVVARYEWSEENELRLTFSAKTDAPTIVNLTNHVYFNLNGGGSVMRHFLRLNASEYLPTDDTLIPVGDPEPVAGTPMDFLNPKTIGRDSKKDFPALNYGKGYDACWVIDGYRKGQLQEAAELWSNHSGRCVKVFTTQPGVQVYTGNWLEGCPVGKRGRIWHDYNAVALECQHFPDSPNRPEFPTTVLRPGKTFHEAIIFAFGVRK